MSGPSYPAAAPSARPRPSSVTISSYLLILYAVLQVVGLILALSTLSTMRDVYRDLYAGTSVEGTESIATFGAIGGSIFGLILAAGFVVLALINNRGKNPSRIVTWVIGGLGVCCGGVGLVSTGLTNSMNIDSGTDAPSPSEVQRALNDALPAWYHPLTIVLAVLGMIVLLVAVILLALPASNEFFRKPAAAGWEPPVPGAVYPAYPAATGYPATPGYPPATGYPPASPDPSSAPPAADQSPGTPSDPARPSDPVIEVPPQPASPYDPPASSTSPSDPSSSSSSSSPSDPPSSSPSSDPPASNN